jgi:hypothetical protein
MATYDVGLDYSFADGGSVLIDSPSGGTNTSTRLTVKPDDIVRFTNNHGSFGATIAGQSTARFNTSSLSVSAGTNGNLTVDASPTFANDQSNITINGVTRSFYYSVISNVDDTPSDFDIGKPVVSADLSTVYEFEPFVVTGINAPTDISIVNGQFKKGSTGSWITESTVEVNDIVYCRGESNSGYASGFNVILTIGTVQDANPITTKNNPDAGERILFPKTVRPISISDLTNFFAAPVGHFINPPRYMSAFRRGGDHVPDIPENAAVADTNQANDNTLGDFLTGTATTVYFDKYPINKSDFQLTDNANPSAQVAWNAGNNDWTLGYSPLTKYNVEYRYEITENVGAKYGSGVVFAGLNGPAGDYAVNNVGFSVSKTVSQYTEREYSGVVKIFMKSLINPLLVLETEVSYTLDFYYN